MKISARNLFEGTVKAIHPGAVNTEVEVTVGPGSTLVGIVTNGSIQTLGLVPGKAVTALVKASSVMIMTEGDDVRLSARNCLPGKITHLTEGPVSAEVTLTLASGTAVHASITQDAAVALGLKVGQPATAVFKASAVILAVSS